MAYDSDDYDYWSDPTAYRDRRGQIRHAGRVGEGSVPGVRGAVLDAWGNVIKGQVKTTGERFEQEPVATGVDRWHLANTPGWGKEHGFNMANLPERLKLTPNIDRFKQQFRGEQKTSWGKRWEDAVQAAKNQDLVRNEYDAERMKRYIEWVAKQEGLPEPGIDYYGTTGGGGGMSDFGSYGYGSYGTGGSGGGGGYGGGGGIASGSSGAAYS